MLTVKTLNFLFAGYYCETPGLSNATAPCDPGYYCLAGAKVPNPQENITGNVCPRDHYCPSGTSDPIRCPIGTFSNSLKNKNISDCQACTEGWYCETQGLSSPTDQCDRGYYCPPGQHSKRPAKFKCTPGHHCPNGSTGERPCLSGTYQDEYGQWECKGCPAGFYCDAPFLNVSYCSHGVQLPLPCLQGYYCPNGTAGYWNYGCPNGLYTSLCCFNRNFLVIYYKCCNLIGCATNLCLTIRQ